MAWSDPPSFTGVFQPSSTFNTYLRDNLNAQGEARRHIWIDPTLYNDGKVGTWSVTTDVSPPNDPYGYGLHDATPGDYIQFKEYLTPGRWSCNIHTATRNDYGTLALIVLDPSGNPLQLASTVEDTIDTVPDSVGRFNCYSNDAEAQFKTVDPVEFDVPTAGLHTIKLLVQLKDIKSQGNIVRLFAIGLQKLEDLEGPIVWVPPRTWATSEYVSAANLETHMRDNLRMSGPFPRRTYIDCWDWALDSGAKLIQSITTALGFYCELDARSEWVEWPLVLPAGDITISVIGGANPGLGIATISWDGTDRGTMDFYQAVGQANYRPTAITFTNSTPKKANLRITNSTKNASSTGYELRLNRIIISFDNSSWADPGHLPVRELSTPTQLNNYWRTPMRMRGEGQWITDLDPVTCPPIKNNNWAGYLYNGTIPYFGALITNTVKLPGYEGFYLEWDVPLTAGTYTIAVLGGRAPHYGQVDVLLDGVEVASNLDFYDTVASWAKRVKTGVQVTTTKTYRVRVRVDSKSAAAADFGAELIRVRFRREGAATATYVTVTPAVEFDTAQALSVVSSFPTTSVLDDFNRANTGPPPSASWTNWLTGGLKVVSNQLAPNNLFDNGGYWTSDIGNNAEAYLTLSTIIAGTYTAVIVRGNPTGTGFDGTYYGVGYIESTKQMKITYMNGTSESDIGGPWTIATLVNGDKIGARARGTTLEAWYYHSSVWTKAGEITHSALVGSSNKKIGVYLYANNTSTPRMDDFGGGAVVVGQSFFGIEPALETDEAIAISTARFPVTSVLDDFNRANENPPTGWTDLAGDAAVISNQLGQTVANSGVYWSSAIASANQEAYVTIPDLANGGDSVSLRVRREPGVDDGYKCFYIKGSPDYVTISRPDNTEISAVAMPAFAAGGALGLRAKGSTISSWFKPAGEGWQQVDSVTDTSNDGSGSKNKLAVFLGPNVSQTADDFGGGIAT